LITNNVYPIHPDVPGPELQRNYRRVSKMLVDASSGILHCHARRLIHRDVAARNFLVDSHRRVTVCDFGMSRTLDSNAESGKASPFDVMPLKWSAPETLMHFEYSEKTDVYAFGVFLCEIAARTEPYSGLSGIQIAPLVLNTNAPLRPVIPPECPTEWATLMQECWSPNSADRPTMQVINERLIALSDRASAVNDQGVPTHPYMSYKPLECSSRSPSGQRPVDEAILYELSTNYEHAQGKVL